MKVYAFEWCDCIYESAFAVVSLHASKRAAYFTMRHEVMRRAMDDRTDAIRYRYIYGPAWKGLTSERWRIREYEVNP